MENQIITVESIIDAYRKNSNKEKAGQMAAYLKNKFPFLGIQKPLRKELNKEFLKEKSKTKTIDWDLVFELYQMGEREFHHLALDYLIRMQKCLEKSDIQHLEKLILMNSWWDSVDAVSPLVGVLCLQYPELKTEVVKGWITSSNIWLKRVSIIFQLTFKDETDTHFLSAAILQNNQTKEFFVNKAIGWALRQYSKTNPDWVREFIATHDLSSLSVREGSKYL